MSNNQTEEGYAPFDLYLYNPSRPAAYAFLALFGIVASLHLVALILCRSFFPIPLIIGCGMEAAAYYFRSTSHDDVRKTLPFLIQNLLLLAAPPFLAATIYMSPRRIARVLNREEYVISPRVITKLFIIVDIACFATQVAGAIMSGSEDQNEARNGKTIIIAGLILQIVAFGCFIAWTGALHARLRTSRYDTQERLGLTFERYLYGLHVISCLFATRNVTRIIEYNQGSDGPILSTEAYLYVLDGLVMLAIAIIFLILHPGCLRFQARRARHKCLPESSVSLVQLGPFNNHPVDVGGIH